MKLKEKLALECANKIWEVKIEDSWDPVIHGAALSGYAAGFQKARAMALEVCASWNGLDHSACSDIASLGEEEV